MQPRTWLKVNVDSSYRCVNMLFRPRGARSQLLELLGVTEKDTFTVSPVLSFLYICRPCWTFQTCFFFSRSTRLAFWFKRAVKTVAAPKVLPTFWKGGFSLWAAKSCRYASTDLQSGNKLVSVEKDNHLFHWSARQKKNNLVWQMNVMSFC